MATSRYAPADRGRQIASPRPKTRDSKDTLCRNIMIYGHCRYEDQGCAFNHDQNKGSSNSTDSVKKSLNVDSPSFTPAQLQPGGKKSSFSSQAANAVPFTPKATPNAQEAESSIFNPATIREFTPQSQNYELGTPAATNGGSTETTGFHDPFGMSTMTQTLATSQFNPYAEEHNMTGASTPFYSAQAAYQAPAQLLQYHQYAPVGPHRSDMTSYQRQAHDFFMPTELREEMQKKLEATRQVLPSMHLPTVAQYHTLVPLDVRTSGGSLRDCKSWTYKAVSKKTGNTYCLRRLTNVQAITRESVMVIASWKRISCGNVVSVIECFTSRDFSDISLIFVHNYHPLSKTLAEHHFPSTTQNSRFPRTTTVAENVLWSYICQFCNALKAIHAEGLAARCIELSKVIMTDKNRIRLSACAILDVLDYETKRPIMDLQQDDFVNVGRVILSIGTNTQTLVNLQTSMEQFRRMYSAELSDRVVWLLTKPSNPAQAAQKTAVGLASSIAHHVLESMDCALQRDDETTSHLFRELENGRVARLMMKLGTINERPEFENDPSWAENGERYQLKLFRDYVFHQVDGNGNPVVNLAHMLSCLSKLDAGTDERIYLASRDNQTCMLVTYKELKKQLASAFGELLKYGQSGNNIKSQQQPPPSRGGY